MLARDVMTTKVVTVVEDTPVDELVRTLLKWRISAAPVVDANDRLVGIVSEGDLIHRADSGDHEEYSWWLSGILEPEQQAQKYAKARGHLVKDVMSTPVVTVSEDDTLAKIASILEDHRIKRVPVLRGGNVTGIISRANLLHGIAASPEPIDAPTPAVSTAAAAHNDEEIRATILNTLHNDIRPSGAINVIVWRGTVDLWGGVETETERQAIRVAAENAPGVTSVNDHLYVMLPALRHLLGADRSD